MINPSDITPAQLSQLQAWATEGLDLNEMQKKINGELGLSATYMEARFLLMDLGIDLHSPEKQTSPAPAALTPEAPLPTPASGTTVVSVDEITPPHALISGKVTFKSGVKGSWDIDKMGRVNWEPTSGEPTEDDLKEFEKELQKVIRQQMGGM